jgi:hypothetical protein
MEEALRRLEAGEDPDAIEADLGDKLESEEPFLLADGPAGKRAPDKKKRGAPRRDPNLYDL